MGTGPPTRPACTGSQMASCPPSLALAPVGTCDLGSRQPATWTWCQLEVGVQASVETLESGVHKHAHTSPARFGAEAGLQGCRAKGPAAAGSQG